MQKQEVKSGQSSNQGVIEYMNEECMDYTRIFHGNESNDNETFLYKIWFYWSFCYSGLLLTITIWCKKLCTLLLMNEEENLYKRCDVMHFWNCNSASGIQVSWLAKFNILEDHLGFMGKTSSLVKKNTINIQSFM